MPRITIVPSDGIMGIDGDFKKIDLSNIDSNIHAVQWNGISGLVEHVDKSRQRVLENMDEFQEFIDLWNAVPIPPIPTPPTLKENIDNTYNKDLVFKGLVNTIASRLGLTPVEILADIETNQ